MNVDTFQLRFIDEETKEVYDKIDSSFVPKFGDKVFLTDKRIFQISYRVVSYEKKLILIYGILIINQI